jgi:myo-inositol-1(or 4)-monophosphatase
MQPMVNIAVRAARQAGNLIVRAIDQIDTLKIKEKSANDYVTEVDLRAEQEIVKTIKRAYPQHGILAEESGETEGKEYEWIIDPLDGTTNFLHGIPQYAISIGIKHRGKMEHAVVYNPVSEEMFTASRGDGARLNDRRIRVANRTNLNGALLGTGIPFREDQDLELYLKTLKALLPGTAGVRRPGSAALDLAYVAAGRFDGFWEFGLNTWDMAAGVLLVQEAGGIVTDMQGGDAYFETGNVVAGNLKVHAEMAKRIKPCL